MDFLLDNPLATMDGPAFLVLYGVLIVSSILAVALVRTNSDDTHKLPVPAIPPEPDPFEIAFLRGGSNELARSVIFSLIHKGLAEVITDEKKSALRLTRSAASVVGLNTVEQCALTWLKTERESKEVFDKRNGLTKQLKPFADSYRSSLEKRRFMAGNESSRRAMRTGGFAAGIVALVGGYKVAASIAYGHFNFVFAIVMICIGVLIIMSVARLPRVTKLGKIYLERLQLAFDNLKRTSQAPYIRSAETRVIPQASFAGVDPLLLSVGLFGSSILVGTVFDDYNAAFQRSQQANNGTGGCGSGCGSGGSSGADGGSSSCGSGCGGGGCGGGCGG